MINGWVHERLETGWVSWDWWQKCECRIFVQEVTNSLLFLSLQTLLRSGNQLMSRPRRNDCRWLDKAEKSDSYVNEARCDKGASSRPRNALINPSWQLAESPSLDSDGIIQKPKYFFHLGVWFIFTGPFPLNSTVQWQVQVRFIRCLTQEVYLLATIIPGKVEYKEINLHSSLLSHMKPPFNYVQTRTPGVMLLPYASQ